MMLTVGGVFPTSVVKVDVNSVGMAWPGSERSVTPVPRLIV